MGQPLSSLVDQIEQEKAVEKLPIRLRLKREVFRDRIKE
jgi:hypothetical protein